MGATFEGPPSGSRTVRLLPVLPLAALAACVQPGPEAPPAPAVAASDDDDGLLELRRAITRAQFEAMRHGTAQHVAFGCPQCSDPMAGKVPDEALIDGPADVWN